MCEELFGVTAQQHLDPTLLLHAREYEVIAVAPFADLSYIASYILDPDPSLKATLAESAAALRMDLRELSHTERAMKKPTRGTALTVPEWLGAVNRANYVVTDSFHGTIFAIINRVPFLTIVNPGRGAARFESLLKMLDLQERLVAINQLSAIELTAKLTKPINWTSVHEVIESEKKRSQVYLNMCIKIAEAYRATRLPTPEM